VRATVETPTGYNREMPYLSSQNEALRSHYQRSQEERLIPVGAHMGDRGVGALFLRPNGRIRSQRRENSLIHTLLTQRVQKPALFSQKYQKPPLACFLTFSHLSTLRPKYGYTP